MQNLNEPAAGGMQIAKLLLEAGANPNHATLCGASPLHVAAIFKQLDVRWQAFCFHIKPRWNRKLPL